LYVILKKSFRNQSRKEKKGDIVRGRLRKRDPLGYFAICITLFMVVFSWGCSSLPEKGKVEILPEAILIQDENSNRVYGWVENLQLPNGLLESSDNSNFVSLYENALAAIVFSVNGDYDRAQMIFDFFNTHLESELKQSPGGFGQFRDRNGVPTEGAPHRWLGDNAWLLIAINNYHKLAGNKKYSQLADALESWIRSLQDKTDGGLWSGFDRDGKRIWKSTEGIIDSFNAVSGYDSFHKGIIKYLKAKYWDSKEKTFFAWKEHEKYRYALDLHSWGYCAFKNMPQQLIDGADHYRTTKMAAINNRNITGFCFDLDLDTIWLEGTGEMIVAYRSAGMDFMAEYYLRELEKMIVSSSKNPNLGGIPYATNKGTHYATGQLWDGAERYPSLASSTWYLLGKWSYDPMRIGRDRNIPNKDMFWME
jgi:hypothetical protein